MLLSLYKLIEIICICTLYTFILVYFRLYPVTWSHWNQDRKQLFFTYSSTMLIGFVLAYIPIVSIGFRACQLPTKPLCFSAFLPLQAAFPGTRLHRIFSKMCAFKIMARSEDEPPGKSWNSPIRATHEALKFSGNISFGGHENSTLNPCHVCQIPLCAMHEDFYPLPITSGYFRHFRIIPVGNSYHIYIFYIYHSTLIPPPEATPPR